MPPNRHDVCGFRPKPDSKTFPIGSSRGEYDMAYNIVAERDNETVRMRRTSSIIALAKARVWASEGWDVTIIDDDENPLVPDDGRFLLAPQ
jgi:hypothetical protein